MADASNISNVTNIASSICVSSAQGSAYWFSYWDYEGDKWCLRGYTAAHWLWFGVLMITFVLSIATSSTGIFVFVRRRIKYLCCGKAPLQDVLQYDSSPITAIIPCYLPNEEKIIESTVEWIMNNVNSPGDFTVHVVYNTPRDMPQMEQHLQLMTRKVWPKGRRFTVQRVMESKSKAENLNSALATITDPYVVIYDADHHPDPDSLILLYEKLQRLDQDAVQGSYYMRNLKQNQFGCDPCCSCPCLARIVDAEFFVDWFFSKPVTRTLFLRGGYFAGSNCLWKREVLVRKLFDHSVQTEDIDMAIQQLLDEREIEFCPEARSGELAPISGCACWRQRLRWTIGWDQVSMRYFRAFVSRKTSLGCCARFSLLWILQIRWILLFLGFGSATVGLFLNLFIQVTSPTWGKGIKWTCNGLLIAGLGPWLVCTLEAIIRMPHRPWPDNLIQVFFVILMASPLGFVGVTVFVVAQEVTSFYKLCCGKVSGWVVTQRASAEKSSKSERTSLMQQDKPVSQLSGQLAGFRFVVPLEDERIPLPDEELAEMSGESDSDSD